MSKCENITKKKGAEGLVVLSTVVAFEKKRKEKTREERGIRKRKSNDELIQHYSEIKKQRIHPLSYEIEIRLLLEGEKADSEENNLVKGIERRVPGRSKE